MKTSLQLVMAVTLGTALLASACEDGIAESGPDGGGAVVDAGPPPTVNSNIPGIRWEPGGHSIPGLEIISSTFTQENLGGTVFNHWYAEVENRSGSIQCFVHVVLDLEGDSLTPLVKLESYADAPAYKSGTGSTNMPCLAPGQHGGFYDINEASSEAPIDQIKRASYDIDTLLSNDAVPSPLAPTVVSAIVFAKNNGWALMGTVSADAGTIYNLGMDVYTIGASGRITDRVSDFHLDTLFQNQRWLYETNATSGENFNQALQFIDFLDGVQSKPGVPVEPRALARAAFRQQRAQVESRRAVLRAAE